MLMHHRNSVADCIHRRFDTNLFSAEPYDARIRAVHAEQDIHERGFPRSVLPQQRVDLALFHAEVMSSFAFNPPKRLEICSISMHTSEITGFPL
jgi:hypothetical protein